MGTTFTKQYQVRSYEADFRGTVRPVTMLNYLQDAASGHSRGSGFSVHDLQKNGMTWVLSRYHVRFLRYPEVGEYLKVCTWRSGIEGYFALREFEVIDENDNPLALATSSWVIVHLETKRPVRLETVIKNFPLLERRALNDDFKSLPKLEKPDVEEIFKVRIADLDLNRHVNHAVYVEWAVETVPREILDCSRLAEIEISYRAEAFSGDTVIAGTGQAEGENPHLFLHRVKNEKDGRELTRMRTAWQRIE